MNGATLNIPDAWLAGAWREIGTITVQADFDDGVNTESLTYSYDRATADTLAARAVGYGVMRSGQYGYQSTLDGENRLALLAVESGVSSGQARIILEWDGAEWSGYWSNEDSAYANTVVPLGPVAGTAPSPVTLTGTGTGGNLSVTVSW